MSDPTDRPTPGEVAAELLALAPEAWRARHDLTSPAGAALRAGLYRLAVAIVGAETGKWPPYVDFYGDPRGASRARRRYNELDRAFSRLDTATLRALCTEIAAGRLVARSAVHA